MSNNRSYGNISVKTLILLMAKRILSQNCLKNKHKPLTLILNAHCLNIEAPLNLTQQKSFVGFVVKVKENWNAFLLIFCNPISNEIIFFPMIISLHITLHAILMFLL